MKKIIFITGPVRSGKSDFALRLANSAEKKVSFVATCGIKDDKEMKERIEKHRRSRPSYWSTIEEEKDIGEALKKASLDSDVIVVDCLTLWVSNLLNIGKTSNEIITVAEETVNIAKKISSSIIFVTNEVGWGIVPNNKLARSFRDIVGRVNQIFAQCSNEAYLMTTGCSLRLK